MTPEWRNLRTWIFALALLAPLAAHSWCGCQCVGGYSRVICDRADEPLPKCPLLNCPTPPVTFKPTNPAQLFPEAPLIATRCRFCSAPCISGPSCAPATAALRQPIYAPRYRRFPCHSHLRPCQHLSAAAIATAPRARHALVKA